MDHENKAKSFRRRLLFGVALLVAGVVLLLVGVIFLFRADWIAGGSLSGTGLLAFVGGFITVELVFRYIVKNERARGRAISEDAYTIQGGHGRFAVFSEGKLEIRDLYPEGTLKVRAAQDPRSAEAPLSEVVVWKYYVYAKPRSKPSLLYALRVPTRYLKEIPGVDRTQQFAFFDIDEERFGSTLERYKIACRIKADPISEAPAHIAGYGDISVYDSGVHLKHLWIGAKSRFVPWDDVEYVFRSAEDDDELIFDCGYEEFHTRYYEKFYRDLAANYPEKILDISEKPAPMPEEEWEESEDDA